MLHLYHGSTEPDLVPTFGKGRENNDFGRGFYCTDDMESALEWACRSNRTGYAYEYYLDARELTVFDLEMEGCSTMEWLALLLKNRKLSVHNKMVQTRIIKVIERFSPDLRNADIITGPRADDSYFVFAKDFLSGSIPYSFLKEAISLSSLGTQIALVSRNSFEVLRNTGIHTARPEVYHARYLMSDSTLRSRYDVLRNREWKRSEEVTIENILDEEWGKDDPRLS